MASQASHENHPLAENDEIDRIQSARMDAVSSLSGAVGHSLNNLLSGFVGYLTLLRSALPSEDARESVPRYLDALDTTVDRFRELTRTLMTVAGRTDAISRSVVDVGALVASLVANRDNISFEIPSDAKNVIGDSDLLTKVITRCIDGSAKVLPAVSRVSIAVEPTANNAAFDGCDTLESKQPFVWVSCDFEHESTDNIAFERFFEPYYTARDVGHGAEFLLSEAWVLTRALNGHIDVRAKSSSHTIVTVRLPSPS